MTIIIRINKKEFHKSKQPIDLDLVNTDQIVVSDKFKHSDDGIKYFIGYKEGEIVKSLCITLPQMNGCIKYFGNRGKSMSFMVKNDDVLDKYNEIWYKIKEKLNIKFHSMPVYDEKYIKAKVREFDGVIKTNFLGNKIPEENKHYTCIACITIDSVMRMEECQYKMNKTNMTKFIEAEREYESGSESDSESDSGSNSESDSVSKSDTELKAKLESNSDSK